MRRVRVRVTSCMPAGRCSASSSATRCCSFSGAAWLGVGLGLGVALRLGFGRGIAQG